MLDGIKHWRNLQGVAGQPVEDLRIFNAVVVYLGSSQSR